MIPKVRTFLVLFFLALVSVPAFAQSDASISGQVADVTGGTVPGVSLTIKNLETGTERIIQTDEAGRFHAPLYLLAAMK